MSVQRQPVKVVMMSLGVLLALSVALAFTQFIAIPRFEEVARTGRVKVAQPTPRSTPNASP